MALYTFAPHPSDPERFTCDGPLPGERVRCTRGPNIVYGTVAIHWHGMEGCVFDIDLDIGGRTSFHDADLPDELVERI